MRWDGMRWDVISHPKKRLSTERVCHAPEMCSSHTVTCLSQHSFNDSNLQPPHSEPQRTDAYTCSMHPWRHNVDASVPPALTHEGFTPGPGCSTPQPPGGLRPVASISCSLPCLPVQVKRAPLPTTQQTHSVEFRRLSRRTV